MAEKFKVECPACGATGLYKGFAEPPGTAVICNRCDGKGYYEAVAVTADAKIFSGRKKKPGVTKVICDGGLWMLRRGEQPAITIEEFEEKVPV